MFIVLGATVLKPCKYIVRKYLCLCVYIYMYMCVYIYIYMYICVCVRGVLSFQSCLTVCDPMDYSASVCGISQAKILGCLPFPFPGDLPDPGIKPRSPALQADPLWSEPLGKFSRCCQISTRDEEQNRHSWLSAADHGT